MFSQSLYNLFFHYTIEFIGSLILAIIFFIFLKRSVLKGSIKYLSGAFLVIVIKDIFLIINTFLPLLEKHPLVQKNFAVPESVAIWINLSLTSFATALFFTSAISVIRNLMSYFLFAIIGTFILIGAGYLVNQLPECQKYFDVLPTIYIASSFLIIGLAFFATKLNTTPLSLKAIGLGFLVLGIYYTQQIFTEVQVHWIGQLLAYIFALLISLIAQIKTMRVYCVTLKNTLQTELAKGALLLESSPFPILISRLRDDAVLLMNQEAQKMFNLTPQDINNFRFSNYFVKPAERIELIDKIKKETVINSFEVELKNPRTQQTFWLDLSTKVIELDKELALYTTFKDTTKRKKKEQDLFLKASTDPLTGLYNRRQFEVMAENEFARILRYKVPACLLMIDIDHFKKINDTYGHLTGDNILKQLALTLYKELRETDVIARYGGEEFVILLSQTIPENALMIAERLRQAAANILLSEKEEAIRFTISIGLADCALFPDLITTINAADLALYHAKETGRNNVVAYNESLEKKEG